MIATVPHKELVGDTLEERRRIEERERAASFLKWCRWSAGQLDEPERMTKTGSARGARPRLTRSDKGKLRRPR
jgi:hypothetical protein